MARSTAEIDADLALVRSAMQAAYGYKSMNSDGTAVQFQDLNQLMVREAALLQERAVISRTRLTRGRPVGI